MKNKYWQCVRGLAILAVVLIHCDTTADRPFQTMDGTYYLFVRNLYSFAVSGLFFLSGMFVKPVLEKSFVSRRLKRLLIPYLLWTGFYMMFNLALGGRYTAYNLVITLLTGKAAMPFYYTIVLSYFVVLTPLLRKAMERKYAVWIVLLSTPFLVGVGYLVQYWTGSAGWIKLTPIWIAFYFSGMLVGSGRWKVKIQRKTAVILWIAAYLVQVTGCYCLLMNTRLSDIAFSQWHITAYLYAAATIFLFLAFAKTEWTNSALAYIGDVSYGIYFVHCFFISCFSAVWSRLGIVLPLCLTRSIRFAFTMIGSLLVLCVLNKILPSQWKKYWGI